MVNHPFITAWIVSSVPPTAILHQSLPLAVAIALIGFGGMATGNRRATTLASACLLFLLIWSKAASDLYGLPSPDTALLLSQFMSALFLMEASNATLNLRKITRGLADKNDETSNAARTRIHEWFRAQLVGLGKMTLGGFALSLGLLVLGSAISVSINQIAFTGALVLVVVVSLLFLLTHRREPDTARRSK